MKNTLCALILASLFGWLFGQNQNMRTVTLVPANKIGFTHCGSVSFENYDLGLVSYILDSKIYGRFLYHEVNENRTKKIFYADIMNFRDHTTHKAQIDTIMTWVGSYSFVQNWEHVNYGNQIINVKEVNTRLAADLFNEGANFIETHFDTLGRLVYLKDSRKGVSNCSDFYYELELVYEIEGKQIIPLVSQRLVTSDGHLLSSYKESIIQIEHYKYAVKKDELTIYLPNKQVFSQENYYLIIQNLDMNWPGFVACYLNPGTSNCAYGYLDYLTEYDLIDEKGKVLHLATYSLKFSFESLKSLVKNTTKHGLVSSAKCELDKSMSFQFTGNFTHLNSDIQSKIDEGHYLFQCYDEYNKGELIAVWKFIYSFELDAQDLMGVYEVFDVKKNQVIQAKDLQKFLKNKQVIKFFGDVVAVSGL